MAFYIHSELRSVPSDDLDRWDGRGREGVTRGREYIYVCVCVCLYIYIYTHIADSIAYTAKTNTTL